MTHDEPRNGTPCVVSLTGRPSLHEIFGSVRALRDLQSGTLKMLYVVDRVAVGELDERVAEFKAGLSLVEHALRSTLEDRRRRSRSDCR